MNEETSTAQEQHTVFRETHTEDGSPPAGAGAGAAAVVENASLSGGGDNKKAQQNKTGHKKPSADENNNNISISVEYAQERWKANYERLVLFQAQHGHTRVPLTYPGEHQANKPYRGHLGNWVKTQRKFKNAGTLQADRFQLLDEIGFDWNPTGRSSNPDEAWQTNYQRLKAFQEHFGHLDVSQTYVEEGNNNNDMPPPTGSIRGVANLSKWMKKQRFVYGKVAVQDLDAQSLERWKKLNELPGFWSTSRSHHHHHHHHHVGGNGSGQQQQQQQSSSTRPKTKSTTTSSSSSSASSSSNKRPDWNTMFNVFVRYKALYKTTLIPTGTEFDGMALGRWAAVQRIAYSRYEQGKTAGWPSITAENIQRLEQHGFLWTLPSKKQLQQQQQQHLQSAVNENSQEEAAATGESGGEGEVSNEKEKKPKMTWDDWFELFLQHKGTHFPNGWVPERFVTSTGLRLGSFCKDQRNNYFGKRNRTLKTIHLQRLRAAGFAFVQPPPISAVQQPAATMTSPRAALRQMITAQQQRQTQSPTTMNPTEATATAAALPNATAAASVGGRAGAIRKPGNPEDWDEWLELYVQNKDKFPNGWAPNSFVVNGIKLGLWCRNQRRAKKGQRKPALSQRRIDKLNAHGFPWEVPEEIGSENREAAVPRDATPEPTGPTPPPPAFATATEPAPWSPDGNARASGRCGTQNILPFRDQHNDVGSGEPHAFSDHADPAAAIAATAQKATGRPEETSLRGGQSETEEVSPQRLQQQEASPRNPAAATAAPATPPTTAPEDWNDWLALYIRHKDEFPSGWIPTSFAVDGNKVGAWVRNQRRAYFGQKSLLSSKRIELLNACGFPFVVPDKSGGGGKSAGTARKRKAAPGGQEGSKLSRQPHEKDLH